jgi:transcriptional regulator with XRE-family HTH domain
MFATTDEEREILADLGQRLRARRLQRNEKQLSTAARIGVSAPTYRKMEQGDPSTALGYWVRAMRLLGDPDALRDTLPLSLFEQHKPRQRAVKQRKP